MRRDDPSFVPPTAANASALVTQNAKRQRDEETADGERESKREKSEEDEEEMEIDDEDDSTPQNNANACTSRYLSSQFIPTSQPFGSPLNNTTICATTFNTPIMHELAARSIRHCSFTFISTVRCLSFVSWCPLHAFIRYQGFQTTQVTWSPMPNAAGERVKMAQVLFETPDLASVAKTALDGFMLKKGWLMSVVYI